MFAQRNRNVLGYTADPLTMMGLAHQCSMQSHGILPMFEDG
jgi:hypothetical protein